MKKPKRQMTVTIGIPAHNEAANIGNLLQSVLAQRGQNFEIEKIIVICDGCTDETANIARSVSNTIVVVERNKRMGKMSVLNHIYEMNKSDILITLDADLIIAERYAIGKIVKAFEDQSVALAVFHQEPIASNSFVGKICRAADMFWIESRIHVNGGDHIHNLQGSATALRRDVVRKVRYPSGLNNDAGYLYIVAKKYGTFKYAYNAKVLYRAPETLKDFWLIASRAIFYRYDPLVKYLGSEVLQEYAIPLRFKLKGLFIVFFQNPLYTSLAVLLNVFVRFFPKKGREVTSKTWEMAQSARKAIII